MNTIDIIILSILGISVLVGLYRGFIASVASLGGTLLCLVLSFWLNPKAVAWVQSRPELIKTLLSYTDAATRIGDQTLAQQNVAGLTSGAIEQILNRVSLPGPLKTLLQNNLQQQVFSGEGITRVGDYVSQTIVGAVLNVLCFVAVFILLFVAIHVVLNLLKAVFSFPVLKQLNSLTGGVFGLLRGMLLCFLAFALLPLVQTMVPMPQVNELIAGSTLAPLFNSNQLILAIMNGRM